MSQYCICRNKTLSYQFHLKSTFFCKLSSSLSSKDFCSFFKKLNKKSSIPTLSFNSSSASTPFLKANMINQFFCNCFNLSVPPLSQLLVTLVPLKIVHLIFYAPTSKLQSSFFRSHLILLQIPMVFQLVC